MRHPAAAIGFSQGEFTAATVVESIKYPDVLALVYKLELLLCSDSIIQKGAMVRVIGLSREILKECCMQVDPQGEDVSLSITYTEDQNVISGDNDKIIQVSNLAKVRGARWVIRLNSIGGFHSPLCRHILNKSDKIFNPIHFNDAKFSFFSCVDGEETMEGNRIKKKLSKQITLPILWDGVIREQKKKGHTCILELGAGCTISGNTRIIDSDIECRWINDMTDFRKMIHVLEKSV